MAAVTGSKYPAIREHLQENIANVYKGMDTSCVYPLRDYESIF